MELPEAFLERMRSFPEIDFSALQNCWQQPAFRGIRRNPLKCDAETLERNLPFAWRPTPFSPLASYLPSDFAEIGKTAMHHAGAFYVQEPSAASAVTVLAPQPGEKILDLCAAPGGKSTQIAGLLNGEGLLWSNEIVHSRAQILLSNMERLGVRNAVVSSCHPETLCGTLQGFFDRVLVDAPCSGEGMFGRDGKAAEEWSPENVKTCAVRQLAILESAMQAVRTGGVLVYSTCTFSPEENEGVILQFITRHPEFELTDCAVDFGRPAFPRLANGDARLAMARRIFPMDGGEGHFVAKLRRIGENSEAFGAYNYPKAKENAAAYDLFRQLFACDCYGIAATVGEKVLLLPEHLPELRGLGVLRAGVVLAENRKNRLEPEHAVFAASKKGEARCTLNLPPNAPECAAFLHGEEIPCEEKGYTAVSADGVALGFGKASGGMLKNRYPKGLRNL